MSFDYDKVVSSVAAAIPPSGIRKFFDIVAEMKDAISLGVGEPDFVTPWNVREAGIYSLEKGRTYYTSNAGLMELREEICRYLERRYGLNYQPKDQVLVTVGGSEAIDLLIRALISPGDEVLIPEPSFVCYKPCTALAGGVAKPIETLAENEFKLMPEQLKAAITPKTKLLILPYPNNPTGAVMNREELSAIAKVLEGTDVCVLSDEIYSELIYNDEPHVPFSAIPGMYERTVLVNGFSKSYAMTGWRMGYAVGPAPLIKLMTKIHQYAIMSAPTTSQYAAIEALKNCDNDIEAMRTEYNHRRRVMLKGFRDMGLSCFEPFGAFYMFPSIRETGMDSETFCNKLLEEEKVAVVPGNAFGASGEGFVRCSYAYSIQNIEEALRRIERFVKRHT